MMLGSSRPLMLLSLTMHGQAGRSRARVLLPLACLFAWQALSPSLPAAEVADAQKLFNAGKYAECIVECAKAIADNQWHEGWRLLKIKAELATGQYSQALKTFETAMPRFPSSVPLRLLGQQVLQFNNRPQEAEVMLKSIQDLARREPWRYTDSAGRVALGRALARSGADARQVLELFFDRAKKDSPESADPYLASGELALEKHDYALAAEAFAGAAKRTPDDPDVHFGLARSFVDDSEQATAALTKALELNARHVDSLLVQVDNAIDSEDYKGAEEVIAQVLKVNPKHHRAWAFRAALAHLAGDSKLEEAHRKEALGTWTTNPEVDHLIGQELSQKYRFAEGARYQRQALQFNPAYRPAKIELSQDLLRLGQEDEGWRLASEVFNEDQYDVVAYNLITLSENIAKFRTLENDDFLVRMDQREAQIYGPRVLDLLSRAKQSLCKKYDVQLDDAIVVEIFPEQKDFAIRTFGLPGGAGFLGVCFGGVITANSPASQGDTPSNWESVLWHEFCHVVTLNKTRNKMPRWLSEGISVYEERQEKLAWGQVMEPRYRELIIKGESTPVSQLSSAFLKAASPLHLQFAYFESSMVVEYLVGKYGLVTVQRILTDLGNDVPINQALSRHTESIDQLDNDFARWFRNQADQLAPQVDWQRPELPPEADATALAAWNKEHPNCFWGLLAHGAKLVADKQWQAAKSPLEQAVALYPGYARGDNPFLLLAVTHRQLGETESERAVLDKLVEIDADAADARLRLMELAEEREEWKIVADHAAQTLAINPLIPAPHRQLAKAAEALGNRPVAIDAYRALLLMGPLDPAETHFRLARLLHQEGQLETARREVVTALEQAPRYLDAHRLLLQMVRAADDKQTEPRGADLRPAEVEPEGKKPSAPADAGTATKTKD